MKAMRFAPRGIVVFLLVACCRQAPGAESGSPWRPFGPRDAAVAEQPQSAAAYAPTPATNSDVGPITYETQMPSSPIAGSAADASTRNFWSKLHMPEVPRPPRSNSAVAQGSTPSSSRNSWLDPPPPAEPKASPMQSMRNGASRVTASTKAAWHKTVAALTPGDAAKRADYSKQPSGSHMARRDLKPPLWKRMLGAKEPELNQPQTVPEWMAQKRVDP
jgi:hypothetical protein